MKHVVIVVMLLFTAGTVFAAGEFLADRHAGYGSSCIDCHEEAAPEAGAWVEWSKCLECHDGYDDLGKLLADREEFKDYNPHDSHLGEPDCTICHSGHMESSIYCSKCHSNVLDAGMK